MTQFRAPESEGGHTMRIRRLGDEGPEVSVVGLGCNNFGSRIDERRAADVVAAALAAGITHFDTAESYGGGESEVFLGRAIGSRRDQVVIATKFADRPAGEPYRPGAIRRRILEGCEGSLRRLGTDRIDLYYQHHPDPNVPLEETLEALGDLVAAGKVVRAACSNFSAEQIEEAARVAAACGLPAFVASQVHWNLLYREEERAHIPAGRRQGMGIVPYFPLESGLLTGKYRPGAYPEGSRLTKASRFARLATADNFAYIERLRQFAEARGHTLLDLAFGWLLAQEGVGSVIAGASTPEQVAQNARAGEAWQLSQADLEALPRR
jgi:aryl-alcohol dehydrogenase-like predicted oxidoreductase